MSKFLLTFDYCNLFKQLRDLKVTVSCPEDTILIICVFFVLLLSSLIQLLDYPLVFLDLGREAWEIKESDINDCQSSHPVDDLSPFRIYPCEIMVVITFCSPLHHLIPVIQKLVFKHMGLSSWDLILFWVILVLCILAGPTHWPYSPFGSLVLVAVY